MKVGIVIFDGADELDFVAPYEVFKIAFAHGGGSVELLTLESQAEVRAASGMCVRPDGVLHGTYDLVIVPGGGWVANAGVGARAQVRDNVLPPALAKLHAAGTTLAAVCTGAMILAAAGLLAGRPATTHSGALDDLRATKADVIAGARVVDDGDIVTSGGVTSGFDLALWLVERFLGPDLPKRIATFLEYERHGLVHTTARTPAAPAALS